MTNTKELEIYAWSRNQKLSLQHIVHHLTECTYLPATPSIRPPRSAVRALALWFEAPTDVHFIPNTDNKIPKNPRPIAAIIKARHVCSTSEIIFKSVYVFENHTWKPDEENIVTFTIGIPIRHLLALNPQSIKPMKKDENFCLPANAHV